MNNTAWHFTGNTLRDGSPIPAIGETLVFPHKVKMRASGYHWSLKPRQALQYARGPLLHKVSFGGYIEIGDNKGVSSERTIIASIDATHLLRRFAADQALSVSHLWDMPEVVREYLTTLDETKREDSGDAALAATKIAVRSNDCYASRMATWSAYRASVEHAWEAALTAYEDAAKALSQVETGFSKSYCGGALFDPVKDIARYLAMTEFDQRVYEAFAKVERASYAI